MEVDFMIRIGIVSLLAIIFYIFWNAIMSYFLEYNVIIDGYKTISFLNNEGKPAKINETSQAKKIFNDILNKNGFDETNIKLDILIDSFEEFLHKRFNCYEDEIIYSIRPTDLIYKDLCCCTLIRQFQTRNVRGEINLERIYIQVYYNRIAKDFVFMHFNFCFFLRKQKISSHITKSLYILKKIRKES